MYSNVMALCIRIKSVRNVVFIKTFSVRITIKDNTAAERAREKGIDGR